MWIYKEIVLDKKVLTGESGLGKYMENGLLLHFFSCLSKALELNRLKVGKKQDWFIKMGRIKKINDEEAEVNLPEKKAKIVVDNSPKLFFVKMSDKAFTPIRGSKVAAGFDLKR